MQQVIGRGMPASLLARSPTVVAPGRNPGQHAGGRPDLGIRHTPGALHRRAEGCGRPPAPCARKTWPAASWLGSTCPTIPAGAAATAVTGTRMMSESASELWLPIQRVASAAFAALSASAAHRLR